MAFLLDPIDDPRPLLDPVETALADYEANIADYVAEAMAAVVEWRWATGSMSTLDALFGRNKKTSSPEWRSLEPSWVAAPDLSDPLQTTLFKHGYDDDGLLRIVVDYQSHGDPVLSGDVYLRQATSEQAASEEDHGDQFDVMSFQFSSGSDQPGPVYQVSRRLLLRVTTDAAGRVVRRIKSSTSAGTDERLIEQYAYEPGTDPCVESLQQLFLIMDGTPSWQRNRSEKELRDTYRPIEGEERIRNLVESIDRFCRMRFDYEADGWLKQATEFRPIDEVVTDLTQAVTEVILDAVKGRSTAKPYRSIALIYSPEHPEGGLPPGVMTLAAADRWPDDRLNREGYQTPLPIEFKQPVHEQLVEFSQRRYRAFDPYDSYSPVSITVEMMRAIATSLHQSLAGSKHVTDDFAVLVLDDHGDVDSFAVPGE